jgi:peroxiredoxin
MLSPRRFAQLGLGAAIVLAVASMATIFIRPLVVSRPLAFAEPGTPAPLFKLSDPDGRSLYLGDLHGQVAILYFTSIDCPNCAAYNSRIQALANRYRNDPRVRFVAIDIDPNPDPLAVRVDAKVLGRPFPTLLDPKSEVATLYSVKSTPQIAIVDPNLTIRYLGPFDDNSAEKSVTHRYVAETLAALLTNRELAFSSGD